jgi:hypothetical protein
MAFHFHCVFCPPARPGGVVGAPPAGCSRFLSLIGPLPGSLCGVRAPLGASAFARTVLVAVTRRARFVRAVTAVTRRDRRDRRNRLARPRPGCRTSCDLRDRLADPP